MNAETGRWCAWSFPHLSSYILEHAHALNRPAPEDHVFTRYVTSAKRIICAWRAYRLHCWMRRRLIRRESQRSYVPPHEFDWGFEPWDRVIPIHVDLT